MMHLTNREMQVMQMLCVIAKLDDAATDRLDAVRRTTFSEGAQGCPFHGHITVASYTGDNEALFIRSCSVLLGNFSAFELVYEKIEVLAETSLIVATPRKSETLTFLHQRIAEKFDDALDMWTKGDRWYPHTTLLYRPQGDLDRVCRDMSGRFSPFAAQVSRIEFSRVLSNGYEIVDHVELFPR